MVSAPGLVLAYLLFGSLAFMLGDLVLVLVSAMQLALAYSSFGKLAFVLVARLFLYSVVSVMGQVLACSLYRWWWCQPVRSYWLVGLVLACSSFGSLVFVFACMFVCHSVDEVLYHSCSWMDYS